jgi:hypothetical protein
LIWDLKLKLEDLFVFCQRLLFSLLEQLFLQELLQQLFLQMPLVAQEQEQEQQQMPQEQQVPLAQRVLG